MSDKVLKWHEVLHEGYYWTRQVGKTVWNSIVDIGYDETGAFYVDRKHSPPLDENMEFVGPIPPPTM